MAFTMSYDMKLPATPKKTVAATVAAPAAKRTGRAARANSPQAKAEALFERPAGTPDAVGQTAGSPVDKTQG